MCHQLIEPVVDFRGELRIDRLLVQPWIDEWLSTVPLRSTIVTEKSVIQYLNTDLDLVCDTDPRGRTLKRNVRLRMTPGASVVGKSFTFTVINIEKPKYPWSRR